MGITYNLGSGTASDPLAAIPGNPAPNLYTLPVNATDVDSAVTDWTQYAPFIADITMAVADANSVAPGGTGYIPTYASSIGQAFMNCVFYNETSPETVLFDFLSFDVGIIEALFTSPGNLDGLGQGWMKVHMLVGPNSDPVELFWKFRDPR